MTSLLNKLIALEENPEHANNTLVSLAEVKAVDIYQLEAVLADKGIKVGKFIGAGTTAVVFELENKDGKKIPSAVLRIESKVFAGNSTHPFVLQPVASYESDEHVAHIMPRAEQITETSDITATLKTIAALKAEGELEKAWDLKPGALMRVMNFDGHYINYSDGTPVSIIADSNAVGSATIGDDVNINSVLARAFDVPESNIVNAVLGETEIQHVQSQMQALYDDVKAEVQRKGIIISNNWQERTAGRAGRRLG